MRKVPLAKTEIKFDVFALKGGLDLHTPQTSLDPGYCRAAKNYECSINGGYTRIPGYERFDGHPSPTAGVYSTIAASAVAGIAVGDTVNGQTSGATGVVAAIDVLTVVYTKATGTFVVGENLRKVAVVIGTITTVGVPITNQVTIATYQLAATNIYRADIAAVPGSGSIIGLWVYNGLVYAVRNNAGGTAAVLFRQSGTGWTAVPFSYEVAFQNGNTAPAIGGTITKGAVSAVVRKIALESGGWSTSDAKGRFICDAPTGGTFSAGALTAGGVANLMALAAGPGIGQVQFAISWLPGGRFEWHVGNAGNGVMLYGCDSVNRGFEFDGTFISPINSGQPTDAPTHVKVHKKHVFFSFKSSAQYSGAGTPYGWTALTGSAEIAVDDNITSFIILPGTTSSNASAAAVASLAIVSNAGLQILYGTGPTDWELVPLNGQVGGKSYCSQTLSESYIYGDHGIVAISAVKEFGNFSPSTLTTRIRSFVQARRTLATESLINREKSQYRVFFSDGFALFLTIVNGKFLGAMPILFLNPVTVAANGPSVNGDEVSYFGSTNGFVYAMDTGTSFDGSNIDYSFDLSFASEGNARVLKRYRQAVFEMQGDSYAEFNGGWSLSYGDQDIVSSAVATKVGGVYWDAFTWDQFVWDGIAIAPSQMDIQGSGENLAVNVSGSSALWGAFTINSLTLRYTPRRVLR